MHDTLFAACDKYRYQQLGWEGYHASCAENLNVALGKMAATTTDGKATREMKSAIEAAATATKEWTPDPLNLFMNVPVEALAGGKGGELKLEAGTCPKGGGCAVTGGAGVRGGDECVPDGFECDFCGFQ